MALELLPAHTGNTEGSSDFSLRRCQPDQVQRDSLNSFQNTPKAGSNVRIKLFCGVRFFAGVIFYCTIESSQ